MFRKIEFDETHGLIVPEGVSWDDTRFLDSMLCAKRPCFEHIPLAKVDGMLQRAR